MNKYLSFIKFANYGAFLLAIISLPFHWRLANILLLVWLLLWVAEGRLFKRSNIRPLREFMPSLLCLSLVLLELISLCWADNQAAAHAVIERHIGFMVLPLVCLFGVNEHYNSKQMFTALAASAVCSVFHYLFSLYWVENANYVMFWTNDLNNLYINEGGLTMQMKHKLFYCIVLCVALCGLPSVYMYYRHRFPRWQVRLTISLAACILIVGVLLTYSRAGTFSMIIILATMVIMQLRDRKRTIATLGAILLLLLFFLFHPRMDELKNDPRMHEWQSAWNSKSDIPFFGKGAGQEVDFMIEAYQRDGYAEGIENHYGPHNQYVSTTINLGYPGLIVLVALLFIIPCMYKGKARQVAVLISILYGISMLTDDVLLRIDPLFTLMITLVILQTLQHSETTAHPISKPNQSAPCAKENQ